jgi:hypothetical protein
MRVLLAAVVIGLLAVPADPAQARSTWEKEGNVITITVNVAVIGANADGKAAFFEQAFASYYPPGGFQVSCFTVIFELDAVGSDRPIAGRHSLFVVPVDRSEPWISEAQVISNPSQRSGRSYMSDWDDGSTVVHEISHLMGLPKTITTGVTQPSVPTPTRVRRRNTRGTTARPPTAASSPARSASSPAPPGR